MKNREHVLKIMEERGKATSAEISAGLKISRQYVHLILSDLILEGKVIKVGSTRGAFYVTRAFLAAYPEAVPNIFRKRYTNRSLEEQTVLHEIEEKLPRLKNLPENVRSIFTFAFSEMLNNAIEHSSSRNVAIEVVIKDDSLLFTVNDAGVGVYRNIMQKRRLRSETEAMQDLLKGKVTTMPKSHSGQGIFFTSRAADTFTLDSFGRLLNIDNASNDVVARSTSAVKRGTRVVFEISTNSERHLDDLFKKYANLAEDSDYGFDKTDIRVRLYTTGGVNISRPQARRILSGLEKFKVVVFDYDQVPLVGQAFADEIYRVFQQRHPHIRLENEHMSDGVRFMIERAQNERRE